MKKFILLMIIIVLMIALCGCSSVDKVPRVEIVMGYWQWDSIYLPLRDNYTFAENTFYIQDTDIGYDIIIHCIKED